MEKVNYVSVSALKRVFHIFVHDGTGTAFVVESEKGKFLVTAKHMFEDVGYPESIQIKIQYQDNWYIEDVKVYYHDNQDIDIAVMKSKFIQDKDFPQINYDSHKWYLSQDVFMLGFPYGITTDAYDKNNGFPIALIKKGCLSGWSNKEEKVWIDWDTNQGFSGGPVIYRKYGKEGYSDEEYIAGVIKGYRKHKIKVYDKDGEETEMYVEENSGIGVIYRIEHAFEIINKIQ